MKHTIKIAVLIMITGFFTACQQPQSADKILADETQRNAVMQTIADDHEMMMEMMDVMMHSEHGKMMMSGNKEMMGMMMGDREKMMGMMKEHPDMMHGMMQNMMQMCREDSSQCDHIAQMMSSHHGMMKNMMGMMHQKGMMNDECYKSCMSKMGGMGKGMMGDPSQKMGMDKSNNNNHSSHH